MIQALKDKYPNIKKVLLLLAIYAIGIQLFLDISYWLDGETGIFNWGRLISQFFFNYPNLLLLSYLNYQLICWLDQRWPWKKGSDLYKRLVLDVLLGISVSLIQVAVINLLIFSFSGFDELTAADLLHSLLVGAILNLILLPTMEFYLQYTRYYEAALANEQLKKQNSKLQYEMLKNQLNPHFLFNSLNTVSSLVTVDPAKSKKFIRRLSKVYRRVLEFKDYDLVPLEKELDFLRDYVFLLKTRFDERITVDITIEDDCLTKDIIPMSLQILIENAVKHNVASNANPLAIEVTSTESAITVRNNLQVKGTCGSWGIGLESLRKRYRYYDHEIKVQTDDTYYQVTIPLI